MAGADRIRREASRLGIEILSLSHRPSERARISQASNSPREDVSSSVEEVLEMDGGRAMNWKPISEKPTAGVDVLLWEESGRFCKGHCGPEGKFWAWSDGYREVDCSHWSLITPPSEGVEQLTQLIPHDGKSMAEFLSLDAAAKRIRALRQHTVPLEEVYAEWTGSGKWQAHQADLQRVAYAAIESPDPSTALAEALEELVTAFERPSRQFLDSTRVEMEPWLKQARAALALHRKATT